MEGSQSMNSKLKSLLYIFDNFITGDTSVVNFGAKSLNASNKSKAHNCKRTLFPTILRGSQMVLLVKLVNSFTYVLSKF